MDKGHSIINSQGININMDSSSRADECWSISPSDPELDIHLLGIEGYSDLSDDNLSTILRSFTESLQQKKSHLNLLEKIEH